MNRSSVLFVAFSFFLLLATTVFAQSGGDYGISRSTIDTGGGQLVGGEYSLISSIGQPDALSVSGGEYELRGGFLAPNKSDTGTEPTISFVTSSGSAFEDAAGTQMILVALDVPGGGTLAEPATATFSLAGAAVQDQDYALTVAEVVFPAGTSSSSQFFPIHISPDTDPEDDESIVLMLGVNGAQLGSIPVFTFTILNDDGEPTLTGTDDVTPDPTGEVTPEPTSEVTSEATAEVAPEPTEEVTPDVSPTETATQTNTATSTETSTATATETATSSETTTATDTSTATETGTATETATSTETTTATDTSTATDTATSTETSTSTDTATATASETGTATETATATDTETATGTPPTKIPTLPPTEDITVGGPDKDGDEPTDTEGEAVIVIEPIPIIASVPEASMRVTMTVQDGIVLPLFEWTASVSGEASAYNLVVLNSNDEIVFDEWVTSEQPDCNASMCRFGPDLAIFTDGLVNGTYTWWLRAWQAGTYSTWSDPFVFVVNVTAPALPIMNIALNQGRPTISWPADVNSHWYNIYIQSPSGNILLDAWLSASELSCNSGTCAITPELDFTPGAHDVYIRAWGPGGYSSNGSSPWAGPASFLISNVAPGISTNLSVVSGMQLRWQGVPYATWYNLWVGPQGSDVPTLDAWLLAADLGCEQATLCQLPVGDLLPAGNYHWYVQSYGPGGLSSGGAFDGWAQGPTFSKTP